MKKKIILGQATTEYVVLIVFIVIAVTTVGIMLKKKLSDFVNNYGNQFIGSIFNQRSMHTIPRKLPK